MKLYSNLRIGPVLATGLAFLAIAVGSAAPARAEVIIGSFAAGVSGDYTYTGGATSTFSTTGGPIAGFFTFSAESIAAGAPAGPLAATINLSASSTGPASIEGPNTVQDSFSGTYSIVGTGAYAGIHFVDATFSDALLSGRTGGRTVQFSDSSDVGTVVLTSAYLNLAPPESFSVTLASLTTAVGTQTVGGHLVFKNFKGSDVETQAASITPEPSSMAIAGLGALGLIGYGIRRRRGA